MMAGKGVALRDDDFPVLRPSLLGARKRLDTVEPPTDSPAKKLVPPPLQPQGEGIEAIVERILRRLLPGLVQQRGGHGHWAGN
jgi:hypothetical protein